MSNEQALFAGQLQEVIELFPSLYQVDHNGAKILKGSLPVVDREGKHWEDYEVEIHCSENFPYEFPMLFETSGKIPKLADWHVYEDSLSCCVKVRPEELLRCKAGITVVEYIREEVLPYLFNQTHRRVEGYYVNGEYSHGAKGVYEYYAGILKTGWDIHKTLQLMRYVATRNKPHRTSMCFCGKKAKFRHCHREAFLKLKLIGNLALTTDIHYIAKGAGLL